MSFSPFCTLRQTMVRLCLFWIRILPILYLLLFAKRFCNICSVSENWLIASFIASLVVWFLLFTMFSKLWMFVLKFGMYSLRVDSFNFLFSMLTHFTSSLWLMLADITYNWVTVWKWSMFFYKKKFRQFWEYSSSVNI